ncbi:MAG: hypothetical protein HYS12_02325 [Planctomycetes bacterium]|nr:hypothetical protein [Planctomycetota bacterium]
MKYHFLAGADDERVRLLFGPYQAPALRRGSRAWCLYRDRLVVITGWSDAPIPWPLCRGLEPPMGGTGPLVDEELARAVRHESALAIQFWWGIGSCAVGRWRRALGVGRMDSPGSRQLIFDTIRTSIRSWGNGRSGQADDEPLWTAEEVALVGVLPDEEVAQRTGRTLNAVRLKRKLLRRPNPKYPHWRRLPWTPEQDELVLTLPPAEAAARTGHTFYAVRTRKNKLRRLGAAPRG